MIPYGRHCIDQADIEAVIDVLRSDWLTCGPVVESFDNKLAETVNAHYAVSCSNGTTSLHLALLALDITKNDVVLVPAITFLASANAVRYVGADVVFVDVDPTTGLMTAETLEEVIIQNKNKNLKAVINVHLAGQCENLEKIAVIARKYGLLIIEDAAHAIGTHYISKEGSSYPIGSNAYCDLTTFSFHPVKTIAMGEGGAVTTNDPSLAQKLKIFRSHGMLREESQWINKHEETGPWYYEMHELGYNYRVSDINCALGLSQLHKLEIFKQNRMQLVEQYDELFKETKNLIPLRKLYSSDTSWHLYVLLIDFHNLGVTRKALMERLKEQGIGTQVHYIPVYKQPYYKKIYGEMILPGSEEYYSKCLSIPLYTGLDNHQLEKIAHDLKL
ncbi:MAG: UDP-4-amino-4,6-dideoxy-N-acetyl-beta-L-altrosamine transaminase [Alphaproteobacteria bacterium]|nr:UDP-4-amino-4,6-dideoxy-N-acetyl-beta-L-altrosamine transaminase [Alphaproteobacteria bacterium]